MQRFRQYLALPTSESNLAIALVFSAVLMGVMLCAVLWQTSVIEQQRDVIRLLWHSLTRGGFHG